VSWQKPARIGVAIVGLASALAVYLMMGERKVAPAPQPIAKSNPKAIVETEGSVINRFIRTRKDFEITGTDVLTSYYEDGTKKLTGNPLIFIIHKGESRTVQIEGREARISQDENSFELQGPVKLLDSDGFWLKTDQARVNRVDSIAHVPGAATFGKGRMTGSGVGCSYDQMHEVLLIGQQARIKTVDSAGKPVMEMAAGSGMLDRAQHLLTLDSSVHVVRNDETIDTDLANGRLSVNNDVVTYVELHGNARVAGGASIDAMNARDIALDYAEDGKSLEAVKMAGSAALAMKGEGGKQGLQIAGDTVDLALAADGMLTSAVARNHVRLDLPAVADAPPRSITAQTLDGTGQAGKGLTMALFTGGITFVEQALPAKAAPADNKAGQRTARAQKLEATLASDAVTAATFTGDATFEETGLKGCAERLDYQPQKNSLALTGATTGGNPIVADEQVAIEGESIDVGLETRKMNARGAVRSSRPGTQRCRPSSQRPAGEQGASNLPRLLKADAPIMIRALSLEYDSRTGLAKYTGSSSKPVALDQEDTSIGAEIIVIDQTKGDLTATGGAVSRLMLDNKITTGLAYEIRYSDQRRLITYVSAPKMKSGDVSLKGPDNTLSAGGIELGLAAKENTLEQLHAERNVRLTDKLHTVRGGATLDYSTKSDEYEVKGDGTTPVIVVSKDGEQCRQSTGHLITFGKNNSKNVTIKGGEIRQAKTEPSSSACTPSTR